MTRELDLLYYHCRILGGRRGGGQLHQKGAAAYYQHFSLHIVAFSLIWTIVPKRISQGGSSGIF